MRTGWRYYGYIFQFPVLAIVDQGGTNVISALELRKKGAITDSVVHFHGPHETGNVVIVNAGRPVLQVSRDNDAAHRIAFYSRFSRRRVRGEPDDEAGGRHGGNDEWNSESIGHKNIRRASGPDTLFRSAS